MRLEPLDGPFGRAIHGVDLSQGIDDDTFRGDVATNPMRKNHLNVNADTDFDTLRRPPVLTGG